MNNPFTPAEWGATYDLAGAKWTPVHDLPNSTHGAYLTGTIVISTQDFRGDPDGRLWRISGRGTDWPPRDKDAEEYGWSKWKPNHNAQLNSMTALPLLPSPAFVNQQTNPRAVAIAALERAGFRRMDDMDTPARLHLDLTQDMNATLAMLLDDGHYPGVYVDTHDPALARYAVDCFEVLHAWAAAINWEVHDEH